MTLDDDIHHRKVDGRRRLIPHIGVVFKHAQLNRWEIYVTALVNIQTHANTPDILIYIHTQTDRQTHTHTQRAE
jgi:hypothetical protein